MLASKRIARELEDCSPPVTNAETHERARALWGFNGTLCTGAKMDPALIIGRRRLGYSVIAVFVVGSFALALRQSDQINPSAPDFSEYFQRELADALATLNESCRGSLDKTQVLVLSRGCPASRFLVSMLLENRYSSGNPLLITTDYIWQELTELSNNCVMVLVDEELLRTTPTLLDIDVTSERILRHQVGVYSIWNELYGH